MVIFRTFYLGMLGGDKVNYTSMYASWLKLQLSLLLACCPATGTCGPFATLRNLN